MRSVELQLRSCSVGSNSGVRVHLPADAPPVPPVPAQYLDQLDGIGFISKLPTAPESFTRGEASREHGKASYAGDIVMDEDDDMHSRGRSEEDDIGVFGRMEE
jgi:hypothetical protein